MPLLKELTVVADTPPWAKQSVSRAIGGQVHGRGMVEWCTPLKLQRLFGTFDLDPCAPIRRPWDTARKHYTIQDDGLKQVWEGRVWLNPPYDSHFEEWLARLADHKDGIALIFARTDTKAFHRQVWKRADALLFLKGRVQFHQTDGTVVKRCGAPSVLVAYGGRNVKALSNESQRGALIQL